MAIMVSWFTSATTKSQRQAITLTPPASPSMTSMMLTALMMPIIQTGPATAQGRTSADTAASLHLDAGPDGLDRLIDESLRVAAAHPPAIRLEQAVVHRRREEVRTRAARGPFKNPFGPGRMVVGRHQDHLFQPSAF